MQGKVSAPAFGFAELAILYLAHCFLSESSVSSKPVIHQVTIVALIQYLLINGKMYLEIDCGD
jgi:hypothetical protein